MKTNSTITFKKLQELNLNMTVWIETPKGFPFVAREGQYSRFISEIRFFDIVYNVSKTTVGFAFKNKYGALEALTYPIKIKTATSAGKWYIYKRDLIRVLFEGKII